MIRRWLQTVARWVRLHAIAAAWGVLRFYDATCPVCASPVAVLADPTLPTCAGCGQAVMHGVLRQHDGRVLCRRCKAGAEVR